MLLWSGASVDLSGGREGMGGLLRKGAPCFPHSVMERAKASRHGEGARHDSALLARQRSVCLHSCPPLLVYGINQQYHGGAQQRYRER